MHTHAKNLLVHVVILAYMLESLIASCMCAELIEDYSIFRSSIQVKVSKKNYVAVCDMTRGNSNWFAFSLFDLHTAAADKIAFPQ